MDEGSIPEMVQLFWYKFPEHHAEIHIFGDATSNKRVGQTGKSDYFLILNEMKGYGAPVKLFIPESNPKVPDRVNAVNHALRDEDGYVRLLLDPSCHELASDLENVLRDQKGGILKSTNRKDPYFRRTHTSDGLGYWIARMAPVRPPSDRDTKKTPMPRPSYGSRR